MLKFLSPERLANTAARHPWYMVGLWVLIIAATVMGVGMTKQSNSPAESSTQASRAQDVLAAARGEEPMTETIVVASETESVDSPALQAFVQQLTEQIRGLDGTVTNAVNFYETGDESLVSHDRGKTLIVATLSGTEDDADETVVPLLQLLAQENGVDGHTVLSVGGGSLNHEINAVVEKDLQASEVLGLPAALIVLVIVFGALVAAGVPLVLSILAIFVAMGITGVVSNFVADGRLRR